MTASSRRVAGTALLLLMAAGCGAGSAPTTSFPSVAGDGQRITSWSASGAFGADDPIDPSHGGHIRQYEFQLTAGTEYLVTMHPNTLPTQNIYTQVLDASGQVLAEATNGRGPAAADIRFMAPTTGQYRLVTGNKQPKHTTTFGLSITVTGGATTAAPLQFAGLRTDLGDVVVLSDFAGVQDLGPRNADGHGYAEYRLRVRNQSASSTHRVTLRIPHNDEHNSVSGHYLQSNRRSVQLKPDSSASVRLWHPRLPMPFGARYLSVATDGRTARTPVVLTLIPHTSQSFRATARRDGLPVIGRSILVPWGLGAALRAYSPLSMAGQQLPRDTGVYGVQTVTVNGHNCSYVDQNQFRETMLPVAEWSPQWLSYSSYDGVVVRDTDLAAAPPAIRTALWQYVECGGSLVLVGRPRVPAEWPRTRWKQLRFDIYFPGLGECLVIPETNVAKWEPEEWRAIAAMWDRSARPWQDITTPDAANERFPVVADIQVPVRDLFVVMLVFSIVIGPISVLVLAWLRRRIWLLWTVPGLSMLTCAAVVAFMTISDDWNGYVRREGVTVLDENTRRAASVGWLGLFAPQGPGDGLHFSYDTELSQHVGTKPGFTWPHTIDWTNDQHLTSGWLVARIPSYFLVRHTEVRDENLGLERYADGTRRVANNLGADITRLWLADRDGKVYIAERIAAGAHADLTPTAERAAATGIALRTAFTGDWLRLVDTVRAEPARYLRPGDYLAVLEAAPFLPSGLTAATNRPSRSVVLGTLKTP